jgi:hypothetical protein
VGFRRLPLSDDLESSFVVNIQRQLNVPAYSLVREALTVQQAYTFDLTDT